MKIQLFVAAALVAGLGSFAVRAGELPGDRAKPALAARADNAKPAGKVPARGAAASKAGKKAAAAKARSKASGKATVARAPTKKNAVRSAATTNGKASLKRQAAVNKAPIVKRQRVVIDMTTTASIGSFSALASGARAAKSIAKAGGSSSVAYNAIIARHAASYGVPVTLAHAVISVESNYRPSALGSAGEIGLMQIKPATARMMGYTGSAEGLYDPDTNIRFGMKYLAMAHDLGGGSTCGTILRYNAGHAAKRMNPVSAAYCSKVQRHMAGL